MVIGFYRLLHILLFGIYGVLPNKCRYDSGSDDDDNDNDHKVGTIGYSKANNRTY